MREKPQQTRHESVLWLNGAQCAEKWGFHLGWCQTVIRDQNYSLRSIAHNVFAAHQDQIAACDKNNDNWNGMCIGWLILIKINFGGTIYVY